MTQDLQQLLDKIRQEGVEKAQAEAKSIVDAARKEAEEIKAQASRDADELRDTAKKDAAAFGSRAEQTVRQALRDVRLQLSQDLEKQLSSLLLRDVSAVLAKAPTTEGLVKQAVSAYLKGGEHEIDVELGGASAALAAKLQDELRKEAEKPEGVSVTGSQAFPEGFTIRLAGGRVEQCFTDEAVTDALANLLRPQLAALLRDGAAK